MLSAIVLLLAMKRGQALSQYPLLGTVFFSLLAFAAGFPPGGDLAAEELRLSEGNFQEEFAGGADVSGELLAALAYETGDAPLDINEIRLDYPGAELAEEVCVRFTTSDGRYYALNAYDGQGRYGEPPTLPIPTRHDKELRTYSNGDFLVLAFAGGCDGGAPKTFIAARVNMADAPDHLLAYVNINRGRVGARLMHEGREVAKDPDCERPETSHVAYSRICSLPVKELPSGKPMTLWIDVTSLIGTGTSRDYAVFAW
ncbi:hypothetical protein [Rhodospirillaceae bacterium SYSU D60014]|uniref:hypothetical protein n=1 Tax=Virgifigura deserti TaxID=2268457 RepID=UPI000E666516